MARRKRQNPLLALAREYLAANYPELVDAPMRVHMLDGPPGSPRYAVTIERCHQTTCPHGVAPEVAADGACSVPDCPLRMTTRILLDHDGAVVLATHNTMHWN